MVPVVSCYQDNHTDIGMSSPSQKPSQNYRDQSSLLDNSSTSSLEPTSSQLIPTLTHATNPELAILDHSLEKGY
jgi:hypothetical protein